MERKIIKSELGIMLSEDNERVYMSIDGYEVFNGGLPKALMNMVDKSYENLVGIRKREQSNQ